MQNENLKKEIELLRQENQDLKNIENILKESTKPIRKIKKTKKKAINYAYSVSKYVDKLENPPIIELNQNVFREIPKRAANYPEKTIENKDQIIMYHYETLNRLAKKYISIYGLNGRVFSLDLVHEAVCYMLKDSVFNSWINKGKETCQLLTWTIKKINNIMISPLKALKGFDLLSEDQEACLQADIEYMLSEKTELLRAMEQLSIEETELLLAYSQGKLKDRSKRIKDKGRELFNLVYSYLRGEPTKA